MKFKMPTVIACGEYVQSMANCCTRIFQNQCGITYRTNS